MSGLKDASEGEVSVLTDEARLDARRCDERGISRFGKVFGMSPRDVEGGVFPSDPLSRECQ